MIGLTTHPHQLELMHAHQLKLLHEAELEESAVAMMLDSAATAEMILCLGRFVFLLLQAVFVWEKHLEKLALAHQLERMHSQLTQAPFENLVLLADPLLAM